MGKRQVRIFRKDIDKHLDTLVRQQAHVVLRQGMVYRGRVKAVTEQSLTIENQRLKDQVISVADIEEIIYDLVSAY